MTSCGTHTHTHTHTGTVINLRQSSESSLQYISTVTVGFRDGKTNLTRAKVVLRQAFTNPA